MTDIEIANSAKPLKIKEVAKKLGLSEDELILYGEHKAKITRKPSANSSKLILLTAINPTKAGEGKTTVSIGLADALALKGKSVCLALREPSLGPVFGIKGGACGGGYSQILPMEEINLHFTGDFHAITAANNLLCAMIDNHIFQGNELEIQPGKILFHRCLDVNDRALRNVNLGERDERFTITAASEIMAIVCMAEDIIDLKTRLGKIIVALNSSGNPVYASDLQAENAMAILLKDALKPNLVQTLAGTPALVHCGPFANIAHGCNSVLATKTAMSLADYVVTEAGFGADLGAQKFLDFKCRQSGLIPSCVVLVVTLRALKLHGGVDFSNLDSEDARAVERGFANLEKHIDSLKNVYSLPLVVTLNRYKSDSELEIQTLNSLLNGQLVVNDVWAQGGKGGLLLAEKVVEMCANEKPEMKFSHPENANVEEKLECIVRRVYGGKGISLTEKAKESLKLIKKLKLEKLPIIVAKTQYSLSGDEKLLGAPKNFSLVVQDFEIRNGAGFLVAICGKILLMPALSKTPAALRMKIDENQKISGLS